VPEQNLPEQRMSTCEGLQKSCEAEAMQHNPAAARVFNTNRILHYLVANRSQSALIPVMSVYLRH
jgi:hypothetical protein